MFISNLFAVLFLLLPGCNISGDAKINQGNNDKAVKESKNRIPGYDFNNPDEVFTLPPVLHEISGIILTDSSSVASIQDEVGVIFIYDLEKKEITKNGFFYSNGDYEGIASAGKKIYVLRSDGELFEKEDINIPDPAKAIKLKGIEPGEYECLCCDRANARLLIGQKDSHVKNSSDREHRLIYEFDLVREEFVSTPVMTLSLKKIRKFAADNHILGKKGKEKNYDDIRFRPSDFAINPITGKLFMLSEWDHMLFVFTMKGVIEKIVPLDRDIFNMPEGIAFFRNGDLLISNEGENKKATIVRLNYHPL